MATPPGKAVNLRVRPLQSVDLCYPVDGVISKQSPTLLGSQVEALDVEYLYSRLSETVDDGSIFGPKDPSRLVWDSFTIYNYLFNLGGKAVGSGVTHLSHLRNASEAADVDSALLMRQNAYLTSYSPEVLCRVRRVYYDNPE